MDLNNLSFFKMANQELNYLTARQKVLAANLANANTPNYLAKDLERPNFSNELRASVALKVTNEKHMMGLPSSSGAGKVFTPKPEFALTIDGNGVILEDQLNKVAETKGDYNRLITLYGQYRTMLQTANTKINA